MSRPDERLVRIAFKVGDLTKEMGSVVRELVELVELVKLTTTSPPPAPMDCRPEQQATPTHGNNGSADRRS